MGQEQQNELLVRMKQLEHACNEVGFGCFFADVDDQQNPFPVLFFYQQRWPIWLNWMVSWRRIVAAIRASRHPKSNGYRPLRLELYDIRPNIEKMLTRPTVKQTLVWILSDSEYDSHFSVIQKALQPVFEIETPTSRESWLGE